MQSNSSSTDSRNSEKVAADTPGDSPTDQRNDFVWPWYDEATWGVGDAELKGYVTTRRELYLLAREHAEQLVFIDFCLFGCIDRAWFPKQAHAQKRMEDICRLIGSALTNKAIQDAVQLACRRNKGKEDWDDYVQMRLRWHPSPWGFGEPNPPPDACLDTLIDAPWNTGGHIAF